MRILKWAHLSSNSTRFSFGGRWRERCISGKSTDFNGKMVKSSKMWRLGALGMLVFISGLHFRVMEKNDAEILENFDFSAILGPSNVKISLKIRKITKISPIFRQFLNFHHFIDILWSNNNVYNHYHTVKSLERC